MTNKKPVLIIAEAGVNHNGDYELAKKLVDVAAEAKADIVKFQTFIPNKLASRFAGQAEYQKQNMKKEVSQVSMLEKLTLNKDAYQKLQEYSHTKKIEFLSTPFEIESAELLAKLNMPYMKIPSGEITNLPFLKKIGSFCTKVILSTGMSTLTDIEKAIEVLTKNGTVFNDITVLHCNTEYPTPYIDVNLNAMLTIKEKLGVRVGYSDHTLGIEVSIAAVALGAEIIEKHFTLDQNLDGPDHKASMTPNELVALVKAIRNTEACLGSKDKTPSASEIKNMIIARKSIHVVRNLQAGYKLRTEDLEMKRPGDGISPMDIEKVIGMTLLRDLCEDEIVRWTDLK